MLGQFFMEPSLYEFLRNFLITKNVTGVPLFSLIIGIKRCWKMLLEMYRKEYKERNKGLFVLAAPTPPLRHDFIPFL